MNIIELKTNTFFQNFRYKIAPLFWIQSITALDLSVAIFNVDKLSACMTYYRIYLLITPDMYPY